MARTPNIAAVSAARRILAPLRIQHPRELDVELIANSVNLLVRRAALEHEEGRLIRVNRCGIINVAEQAYASNKWRFVVAHEVGHFIRHADNDNFEACTKGDLTSYVGTGRESEANDFAAELLMPERLFRTRCDRRRPSLRDISEIAGEFETSLTATALRFVQYCPEPCAVVFSTNRVVQWLDWSPDFRLGIRKGTSLTSSTYAGDLFDGKVVQDRASQVDGEAWSDSPWAERYDVMEHSRKVAPDSVLTFLWHSY